MLYSILFKSDYLLFSKKSVPLQCVFHSIRFKVNKGWSKALLRLLPEHRAQKEKILGQREKIDNKNGI